MPTALRPGLLLLVVATACGGAGGGAGDDDDDDGGGPDGFVPLDPDGSPADDAGPPCTDCGHVTYQLEDRTVFRIEARAGAAPEDVSAALEALSAGGEERWLMSAPDGESLLVDTTRFDADCANAGGCLALLSRDLSAAEVLRADGAVLVADSPGAVASGGDLVIFPARGPAHGLDLFATARDGVAWGTPRNLTAASPFDFNSQPAISADGARVVFDCGDVAFSQPPTNLCEVAPDGTGLATLLTPDDHPPGGAFRDDGLVALHHPTVAFDGSVIFEADWAGEEVWRLDPGAALPRQVAAALNNDNTPCVLPDGRIASLWLERPGGASKHEIKVMAADGSGIVLVLIDVDVLDVGLGCGL